MSQHIRLLNSIESISWITTVECEQCGLQIPVRPKNVLTHKGSFWRTYYYVVCACQYKCQIKDIPDDVCNIIKSNTNIEIPDVILNVFDKIKRHIFKIYCTKCKDSDELPINTYSQLNLCKYVQKKPDSLGNILYNYTVERVCNKCNKKRLVIIKSTMLIIYIHQNADKINFFSKWKAEYECNKCNLLFTFSWKNVYSDFFGFYIKCACNSELIIDVPQRIQGAIKYNKKVVKPPEIIEAIEKSEKKSTLKLFCHHCSNYKKIPVETITIYSHPYNGKHYGTFRCSCKKKVRVQISDIDFLRCYWRHKS